MIRNDSGLQPEPNLIELSGGAISEPHERSYGIKILNLVGNG